jgi:predicted secreted Zn-dependent protease
MMRALVAILHVSASAWTAVLFLMVAASPTVAEMRTSTETRYYPADAATPEAFIRQIDRNPLHYSQGDAVATLETVPKLTMKAEVQGWSCRVIDATLDFHFVMTIPKADRGRMAPGTRREWDKLVAFLTRHETAHRTIQLDCGRRYFARLKRLSSDRGCEKVRRQAQELFIETFKTCQPRHAALDRRDVGRVPRLGYFRSIRR